MPTDDKAFWVEDQYASRCYRCSQKFNLIRRRHHCRECGQIFCGDCLENVPVLASNVADTNLTIGKALAAMLLTHREEKVCHNCARKRKDRIAAAANAPRGKPAPARRDMVLASRRRSDSAVDFAAQRSPRLSSEGATPHGGLPPVLTVQDDRSSSHTSDPANTSNPEVVLIRTVDAVGKGTAGSWYESRGRMTPDDSAVTPTGSPAKAYRGAFPSGKWALSSSGNLDAPHQLPSTWRSRSPSAQQQQQQFHPQQHGHVETSKERSISYGLTELPIVEPNRMLGWVQKTLARALSKQRDDATMSSRAGSGLDSMPVAIARRPKTFLANPRARFRTGERTPEAGLYVTAFLGGGTFEARTGILELFESRCTRHVIRRVQWLLHEANIRHDLETRSRWLHESQRDSPPATMAPPSSLPATQSPKLSSSPPTTFEGSSTEKNVLAQAPLANGASHDGVADVGDDEVHEEPLPTVSPRCPRDAVMAMPPLIKKQSSVTLVKSVAARLPPLLRTSVKPDLLGRTIDFSALPDVPPTPPLISAVEWLEPICDIAWRVVSQTQCERDPSILDHVDIMTLAGGTLADIEIIPGIAFFQHIASKTMRTRIDGPRILLLGGEVGLHMAVTITRNVANLSRGDGGLGAPATSPSVALHSGFGTVVVPAMDFAEYTNNYRGSLDKQYQRIQCWKPTLIIVEKGIHHYLQDRIVRDTQQITLVTNVGRMLLERIAAGTGARIVEDLPSVSIAEMQMLQCSPLGYCNSFHVSLLEPHCPCVMLSGLPRPTFTTVLLRGAPGMTLGVVKDIILAAIVAAYHLALETHYLVDFSAVIAQEAHVYTNRGYHTLLVDDRLCGSVDESDNTERAAAEFSTANDTSANAAGSQRKSTMHGSLHGAKPLAVLPPEALSLNMGITFPEEVLTCASATGMTLRMGHRLGYQHEFLRAIRAIRDSMVVQTLFLEGPGANHYDAGATATTAGNGSGAGGGTGGGGGGGGGGGANSAQDKASTTANFVPPPNASVVSSASDSSPSFTPTVETADTVRKQRHVYPFYLEGDETLYEFLVERAVESHDSLRHFLHGSRRIVVRSVVEARDPFEMTRASAPSSSAAAVANDAGQLHQPVDDDSTRTAEQLCDLFLRNLDLTHHRYSRVPHCYSVCNECAKTRYHSPSTLPRPCSPHTLCLSFGSFLELSTYMSDGCIAMCGHSLHMDVVRCFVLYPTDGTQVTVSFEVQELPVYDMLGPPLQLRPLQETTIHFSAPPPFASTTAPSSSLPQAAQLQDSADWSPVKTHLQAQQPHHDGKAASTSTPHLPTQAMEPSASLVVDGSVASVDGNGAGDGEAAVAQGQAAPLTPMRPTTAATSAGAPAAVATGQGALSDALPSINSPDPVLPLPAAASFDTTSNAKPLAVSNTTARHGLTSSLPRNIHAFTGAGGAPSTISLVCRSAKELYFACDLQELARSVAELRIVKSAKQRAAGELQSPTGSAAPAFSAVSAPRYEEVVRRFMEIRTPADCDRFRLQHLNPFVDEFILERVTTVDPTTGATSTKAAKASSASGSGAIPPQELQRVRNPEWAYLTREKRSIRLNEPTSIIAAVLFSMKHSMDAAPHESSTAPQPPTPAASGAATAAGDFGSAATRHARTFSVGAVTGLDDSGTPAAAPRPSRVAQYLSQFSSAVTSGFTHAGRKLSVAPQSSASPASTGPVVAAAATRDAAATPTDETSMALLRDPMPQHRRSESQQLGNAALPPFGPKGAAEKESSSSAAAAANNPVNTSSTSSIETAPVRKVAVRHPRSMSFDSQISVGTPEAPPVTRRSVTPQALLRNSAPSEKEGAMPTSNDPEGSTRLPHHQQQQPQPAQPLLLPVESVQSVTPPREGDDDDDEDDATSAVDGDGRDRDACPSATPGSLRGGAPGSAEQPPDSALLGACDPLNEPVSATTIEELLQEINPTRDHSSSATGGVGGPSMQSSSSNRFLIDTFLQEEQALDVLCGKHQSPTNSGGDASSTQASSIKYVVQDLLTFVDAATPRPTAINVEVMFPLPFAAMRYLYAKDSFHEPAQQPANGGGDGDKSAVPPRASRRGDGDSDDGILSSLLRCRPFKAQGGKSKATFFITQDERLMLKQIKLTELKHFLQFAPAYFAQMAQIFTHVQHNKRQQEQRRQRNAHKRRQRSTEFIGAEGGAALLASDSDDDDDTNGDNADACGKLYSTTGSPTAPPTCEWNDFSVFSSISADESPPSALVKIFGVFSIQFKRSRKRFDAGFGSTGEIRYFMLMENLTFRRPVEISFDLKGSQRKRHAAEGSAVLLDQDLVRETKKGFFFFCRETTRSWVLEALCNDAHLLANNDIMDYSTIVSVCRQSQSPPSLSFGIIDYLHPYSGAKVIESKLKGGIENVFGQGKDPTILEPALYKQRFLRWMDTYFCAVPDKLLPLKKKVIAANKARSMEGGLPQNHNISQLFLSGATVVVDDVEYRIL